MANKKGSHQLTRADRIKIEALLKEGLSKAKIAAHLGVHRSTIYNELKRGEYEHRNSDWTTEIRYSPDIAQEKAEENLKVRGTQLKIGNDIAYATLYSYIDKGVFLKLTNKDLPVKKNKKRGYKKVRKQQARAAAGDSIEKRPDEIDQREEFGHWEMDSVIGKKGVSKNTLLVLTERKTRDEIIFKLPDHTDEAVVAALDKLERRYGADMFKQIFKTITVDNGSEFADVNGLERSILEEGEKRTHLYYCHPYSSWERGTNEVTNKMVRRKVPKGTNFDDKTDEEIEQIESWINGYPRRIHGYRSAGELFTEELEKLA